MADGWPDASSSRQARERCVTVPDAKRNRDEDVTHDLHFLLSSSAGSHPTREEDMWYLSIMSAAFALGFLLAALLSASAQETGSDGGP